MRTPAARRHSCLPANLRSSSVLNLPKTASDHEIRERYRQLSIVFHPDKQTDERRKEAATERFLELQKAYEGEHRLVSAHDARLHLRLQFFQTR